MGNIGFYVFFNEDHSEYYDSDACHLYLLDKGPVEIAANSKKIFDYLIENRNVTKTRDQISDEIYGLEHYAAETIKGRSPIDTAIGTLRHKLDKYDTVIKTIYGFGYMYIGPELIRKNSSELALPKIETDQAEKVVQNDINLSNNDSRVVPEPGSALSTFTDRRMNYVMANLRNALSILIEASDINSINNARADIRARIRSYIFKVAIDFESSGDDDWKDVVERHTWLLHKEIVSAQNEIILFVVAVVEQAKAYKKTSGIKKQGNDKLKLHNWIEQMGLKGPKYKSLRKMLTKQLVNNMEAA